MNIIKTLKHQYALSEQGSHDMLKACISCMFSNLVLIMPVGLLYFIVADLLQNGRIDSTHAMWYAVLTAACVGLIILTTHIQYNATFFATYVESGVRRVSIAERLRLLPLSFFGKKDLSDLTSTIMTDCATLENASSHWIPEFFGSILSVVPVGIGLFFYDWRMATAALWVLPVSMGVVLLYITVRNQLGRRQMKAKMACADGIQECLETLRDLYANNAEMKYLDGLDAKILTVEKRSFTNELGMSLFVVSAQMILKLGIVTVILTGGTLLVQGQLNVILFFMFLLVVARMYDPLAAALINLAAMLSLKVQTDRMNEILQHPIQSGTSQLTNQGYDIVFDHVSFAYDSSEPVLTDVSFTAHQGQVTALVGPSGGGKTTVSRLAARFWDPLAGRITVGGMDITTIDPETLLSLYSIVFQDVTLFNNTVMENIRIGRKDATDNEVLRAARMAHCDEFAERLPDGWNTMIGENGSKLSGGERQRISLARAFLKDAPIILLDEATASLDVENETMIQESLSKLIENKTVLVIAHRMRTVSGADKIVTLRDGKAHVQDKETEF